MNLYTAHSERVRNAVVFLTALILAAAGTQARELPPPGAPATLIDWRRLARPPRGTRHVLSDPDGKRNLPRREEWHLVLTAEGPGVLDHLWTVQSDNAWRIEVDGELLWQGRPQLDENKPHFWPDRIASGAGGMWRLLAPVGFARSLHLYAGRNHVPHMVSWRRLPPRTNVVVARAAPGSDYMRELRTVSQAWRGSGHGLSAELFEHARVLERDYRLPPKQRVDVLELSGSGELISLACEFSPALSGTLREVVLECCYDGSDEPALRLPVIELAGAGFGWPQSRWDRYSGDLAAGLAYPWQLHTPRTHYRHLTVYFNFPLPFERGLRIALRNRSDRVQFAGRVRAALSPLSAADARRAGRLCGTRIHPPVRPGKSPEEMLTLRGNGRLVGLGLLLLGGERLPPAARKHTFAVIPDESDALTGAGLLPLWLQGRYAGPVSGLPTYVHSHYEDRFAAIARHFITDPIPFTRSLTIAFTPGPDAPGNPEQARLTALWYDYSGNPPAAAPLAERAERLPAAHFGMSRGERTGPHDKRSRLWWWTEAEELVPMASASGCRVRAVEDAAHDFHASGGAYAGILARGPGNWVDLPVPLPPSPYFALGTYALWGPARGVFEAQALPRKALGEAPRQPQGDRHFLGRVVGSVPVQARVFTGRSLSRRRDPHPGWVPPLRNPAPDAEGLIRLICRGRRMGDPCFLKLDRLRIDQPPPTPPGWREFESGPLPDCHGLTARLPRIGSFDWSGWGAVRLTSSNGGTARLPLLVPAVRGRPAVLVVRGRLDAGQWTLGAGGEPVPLEPADNMQLWRVPLEDVALPGRLTLHLQCKGKGRLMLDAWTLK